MMMRIIMKKQNAKRAKKYVKNIRKRSAKNKIMTKRRKSSLLSSLTWILADYGGLKNKSLKLLEQQFQIRFHLDPFPPETSHKKLYEKILIFRTCTTPSKFNLLSNNIRTLEE